MMDRDDVRDEKRKRTDDEADGMDTQRSLSKEQREVINAGRVLEHSQAAPKSDEDGLALAGALKELDALIAEQRASNRAMSKQLGDLYWDMHDLIEEAKNIRQNSMDIKHEAEQAAKAGVDRAQREAADITIKNVREVSDRCKETLDAMTAESKRRIERLARFTLPDKLFNTGKWVALLLALVVLCHFMWQIIG